MDYLTDAQNDIKAYFETHDIPLRFYQCLFGELVKIWGAKLITPDKYYDAEYDEDGNIIKPKEDTYSYKDQLDYTLAFVTGTAGWGLAFKEACDQCGLMDIYDNYSSMEWVHSDIFDGYIADNMIEALFADERNNDYYRFKMQKEKMNND